MDLTKTLCDLASSMNLGFVLNDKPITHKEVFADTGLLPSLARRADQLCLLCLGYGIGVSFVETEGALLGTKVQFDEVTPNVLRLLCLYDVINEIVEMSSTKDKIPLDELMYE